MVMTATTIHPVGRARRRAAGFTLVEVMISVALVLMIIYGVSRVFKMSTDAVGANQAISGMVRDNRAVQTPLSEDFRTSLDDSPLFLISSRVAVEGRSKTLFYEGQSAYRGKFGGYRNVDEFR